MGDVPYHKYSTIASKSPEGRPGGPPWRCPGPWPRSLLSLDHQALQGCDFPDLFDDSERFVADLDVAGLAVFPVETHFDVAHGEGPVAALVGEGQFLLVGIVVLDGAVHQPTVLGVTFLDQNVMSRPGHVSLVVTHVDRVAGVQATLALLAATVDDDGVAELDRPVLAGAISQDKLLLVRVDPLDPAGRDGIAGHRWTGQKTQGRQCTEPLRQTLHAVTPWLEPHGPITPHIERP